ncbi:MAG: GspH/FimT family pseudopilin, partial [Candidatus Omnitrophota bacterium]
AMTLPFFANFSSSTGLKTAYRQIATSLRTARTYAITKNKNYEVVFDTTATPNRFWIAEAATDKMIDRGFELPSTVFFSSAVTVIFLPGGGLSGGADTTVTIVNAKGKTKSIKISAATGAISEL